MTTFSQRIKLLLARANRAQCAQVGQTPESGPPLTLAPSAPLPSEWHRWDAAARFVFDERAAIALDLGLEFAPGTKAWAVAEREARRESAGVPFVSGDRDGDAIDAALCAFGEVKLSVVKVVKRTEKDVRAESEF